MQPTSTMLSARVWSTGGEGVPGSLKLTTTHTHTQIHKGTHAHIHTHIGPPLPAHPETKLTHTHSHTQACHPTPHALGIPGEELLERRGTALWGSGAT